MLLDPTYSKKKVMLVGILVAALCGGFVFYLVMRDKTGGPEVPGEVSVLENKTETTSEIQIPLADPMIKIIGTSVEGRKIESYTFGGSSESSKNNLLFIGGIHGGYEWNTVMLAYDFINYFTLNKESIPIDTQITIIPSANPDGLYKVIGKEGDFTQADILAGVDESIGRFNANGIDLNRNFDCKWAPESSWRGNVVSAGANAFSEPEAQVMRDFVLTHQPDAVVFWHSQGNSVYASECENGILPATLDIMNAYATAAEYVPFEKFDAYPITGDAEGWLASIGIPAITVELETHETIEWERNLAGVKAMLEYYSERG